MDTTQLLERLAKMPHSKLRDLERLTGVPYGTLIRYRYRISKGMTSVTADKLRKFFEVAA